jgi:tRNA A-37 threonylcarbamoyl transferase component Bud32
MRLSLLSPLRTGESRGLTLLYSVELALRCLESLAFDLKKKQVSDNANSINCPLCRKPVTECRGGSLQLHLECARCGRFIASLRMTLAFRDTQPDDAYLLSGYTRERSESDPDTEPFVGLDNIQKILESCPRALELRLEKLTAAIRRKGPRFGQFVPLIREQDYPLGYGEDEEAFDLMIDTLESRGIIDKKSLQDGSVRVRLRAEHHQEQLDALPAANIATARQPAGSVGASPNADIVLEKRQDSGLYGIIWEGRQVSLNRKVAIKIIRQSRQREADAVAHAQALARCSHENVVTVFQVATIRDPESGDVVDAVVMEWLDGENLGARLGRERFSVQEARQIADALINGLGHLHAKGLAHGNLHPGNVIIASGRTKIIDIDYSRSCSLATLSPSARDTRVKADLSSMRYLLRTVAYHSTLDAQVIGAQESRLNAATALEHFQPIIEELFSLNSAERQGDWVDGIQLSSVVYHRTADPRITYKSKLRLIFTNKTGRAIAIGKPSWHRTSRDAAIQPGFQVEWQVFEASDWAALTSNEPIPDGVQFRTWIGMDQSISDAELKQRHELLQLGDLHFPVTVEGRTLLHKVRF